VLQIYQRLQGQRETLISQRNEILSRIDTTEAEILIEENAHDLLIAVSDYLLENDPIRSMETVITDVLVKLINPDIAAFKINTVEKRNQLETHFSIVRQKDGKYFEQPITIGVGGGAVDVAFFLIDIIMLVNHPEDPRPILFADEPVKNLSADRRSNFMQLLKKVVREFGLQVIMTTHEEEYMDDVDQLIEFHKEGDVTVAKVLRSYDIKDGDAA
jgi:AAA15 family ATPase/GTPase